MLPPSDPPKTASKRRCRLARGRDERPPVLLAEVCRLGAVPRRRVRPQQLEKRPPLRISERGDKLWWQAAASVRAA